jgi:SAM-dependent methyltransferase
MSWDENWEQIFQNKEWGKYPAEDLIRFVAKNFYKYKNRKEIKILEIGCGTGANLWFIAREGFSVYGIDGSKTAIDIAQHRLDKEVKNWAGDLRVGDIIKLPYEDGVFDAVIDNEAVTHNSFENSKKIYKEALRVLAPGGKLFSRTFSTGSWGENTGTQINENEWIPSEGPMSLGEFLRFTPHDLIETLFGKFQINEVELLTRTSNQMEKEIKEWLIICQKKTT